MTLLARIAAGAVLLTAFGAALGGWVGIHYGLRERQSPPGLDEILHHNLALTADQERQIVSLEADFAAQRAGLEKEMSAANRELALAVRTEHSYGPAATQAIEHFHHAMGALQEATIRHIFAMRAVLTPEQAKKFDETVVKALAPNEP